MADDDRMKIILCRVMIVLLAHRVIAEKKLPTRASSIEQLHSNHLLSFDFLLPCFMRKIANFTFSLLSPFKAKSAFTKSNARVKNLVDEPDLDPT